MVQVGEAPELPVRKGEAADRTQAFVHAVEGVVDDFGQVTEYQRDLHLGVSHLEEGRGEDRLVSHIEDVGHLLAVGRAREVDTCNRLDCSLLGGCLT